MALCPTCKIDVRGDNIVRERIDSGVTGPVTTIFSCPNCHVIIGIGQWTISSGAALVPGYVGP